jgi:hypothetical protein
MLRGQPEEGRTKSFGQNYKSFRGRSFVKNLLKSNKSVAPGSCHFCNDRAPSQVLPGFVNRGSVVVI